MGVNKHLNQDKNGGNYGTNQVENSQSEYKSVACKRERSQHLCCLNFFGDEANIEPAKKAKTDQNYIQGPPIIPSARAVKPTELYRPTLQYFKRAMHTFDTPTPDCLAGTRAVS
jgi:hypothetical protein